MTSARSDVITAVQNHWWWRPGWRGGRHFYACHFALADQPALRELVQRYQDALAHLPGLDLIPARWLHITMQGIGFADEISPADLATVTGQISNRLRDLEPPVAKFHRPTIRREAVILIADPQEPFYQLRMAMHDAISSTLGPAQFSEPAPKPGQFRPHVSVAYVNRDGPAEQIVEAANSINPEPVTARFTAISLLVFHRDHRMYEWTKATPLSIGTPSDPGCDPTTDVRRMSAS